MLPHSRNHIVTPQRPALAAPPQARHGERVQSLASSSPPPPGGTADFATLRRFLPYLWPPGRLDLRLRVVIAMVLVLTAKATLLVMPFAFKGIIDRMAPGLQQGVDVALALVAAYALARFGGVLFDNIRNAVFEQVGQDAARRLALDVFTHIHQLSLRFHLERRTGALTRIIERGTKSIDTMLYFLLFNIVPTVFELIAVCIIFWVKLGPAMVAAVLGMMLAYIGFTQKVTNWRTKLRREMVESDNRASSRAVDSLLNYETVKYFNAETHERENYGRAIRRYARAATASEQSLAWLNIGQSLITNLMLAAAMAYTVQGWATGRFTAGDVVLINTLLIQLFRPLDMLGMVYREIKQGLIDMESMFTLIDTPQEVADAPGAPPLAVHGGTLRFDAVDFAYEPSRQILHAVSFEIPAGHSLAVVGHSGAGKSTLSRILYRFYDIKSGAVTIDGQDIRHVSQSSLRAAIGIVPQDTVLFNESIAYNIGYGRAHATQAEIEAAARGASIHDFIRSLPQGYDTQVGERGLKLSGGEKQRVAIARTLLKNPPILILDEATSALDSATEAEIQQALNAVARGRTTLTIAHRLSTITTADEILVMDKGRIVERGRHQALLALGGRYAEIWALQAAEAPEAESLAAE
jgi:ATP-binding cassette subfamily B protein